MHKSEAVTKKDQIQQGSNKFSEVNEFNHENNHVAKAQKQISSQETAGVFDQQQTISSCKDNKSQPQPTDLIAGMLGFLIKNTPNVV